MIADSELASKFEEKRRIHAAVEQEHNKTVGKLQAEQ